MSLLQTILQAQGGATVGQLGQQFGLDSNQTNAALANLIPALAGGVKRNVGQQNGLGSLISALSKGNHSQYLDEQQRIAQPETVNDGNAILGHLFGSKQVSREVAGNAAQQTGIDSSILQQMLPIVATMVMGSLGKQSSGGGALSSMLGGGSGDQLQDSGLQSMLTSFLDEDGDGSVVDDIIGKFFK